MSKSSYIVRSQLRKVTDGKTTASLELEYLVYAYNDRPYIAICIFAYTYTEAEQLSLVDLVLDSMEELCPVKDIPVESDNVQIKYVRPREITEYESACEEAEYQRLLTELENDENPT